MKTKLFLMLLLISTIANAQYTKLHDFPFTPNGKFPDGSLVSDGTFLFGMTSDGGRKNMGVVFKMKPDGTEYSKLLEFIGTANGRSPKGSLIFNAGVLYGMTEFGGTNDSGTIFKIKPDGTGYSKLLDLTGISNGSTPNGSLIYDGTFLYGMTAGGGTNQKGTLFKIKPDGSGYSKLLNFSGIANGRMPKGDLISDGAFLYGMTAGGGTNDMGTIFKIKPDGTGYSKLLDFAGNLNGSYPFGSLISDGTFLYGMASYGGSNTYYGTIFKIMPDGTGFAKLHDFGSIAADGESPYGSLISDGAFLYGMTKYGGNGGNGEIFKIKIDGTEYTKLFDFVTSAVNGRNPYGSLISDGTFFYGMTSFGDTLGYGIVFKIQPTGSGYAKLHSFGKLLETGTEPYGSLLADGTCLYGMTETGGKYKMGTIFKIMADSSGFVKLLDFDGTNGKLPRGNLISDGTFLYGMASGGGANNMGVLFKIRPDGTGYSKLLDFAGTTNGNYPYGSLVSNGTFLYGMTSGGGANNMGVLFKIRPDGTGYSKLLDFAGATNGSYPFGSLISNGTFLYGMTSEGGANNNGIIFKIMPDGTGYTKLYEFDGNSTTGGNPRGSLISDGTYLYGMSGEANWTSSFPGNIFKIKTDGTGFIILHNFSSATDGFTTTGSLISDGTFLYGMTHAGGTSLNCSNFGCGVIFKIKSDGTAYTKLYDFDGADGSFPWGDLVSDGTSLYGMTYTGGINSRGVIFKYHHNLATGLIENYFATNLTFYPNPFSIQAVLHTDNFFENGTLTIYNSCGQTVKQIDNISGQTITFHRDNLPSGLYFIRLMQDSKTFATGKLIITDN
jgi:uncharacterized repeat protein (TIGR03803 family)